LRSRTRDEAQSALTRGRQGAACVTEISEQRLSRRTGDALLTVMPTPSLPTDNLYKFIALAGIALVVATVVLGFGTYRDLLDREAELRAQGGTLGWSSGQPLDQNLPEERDLKHGILLLRARLDAAVKQFPMLSYPLVAGTALMGVGFWLWYVRLQRHLDAIVLRRATRPMASEPSTGLPESPQTGRRKHPQK
jgi:hypothetical protein